MNAITTWQLGVDGIGWVQLESSDFRYAGGLVVAVFDGGNGWTVFDLGSSQVAFGAGTQDQDLRVVVAPARVGRVSRAPVSRGPRC